jgi:TetR/AcrR family transcriptional regulator
MDVTPRRRGPVSKFTARLRKAERKRQLVARAKELFLSLGYQHTTTEKIAQAAGVTEPVLYQHFASKKALFLAVLEEIRQATMHRWTDAAAGAGAPLDKLRAVAAGYLDVGREHAPLLRIMHRTLVETKDAEITALVRGFYVDGEKLLAQIVQEGQKAGAFRAEIDPRVAAWGLIHAALGYTLTLPLGIPLYQDEGYVDKAIDCLMSGLMEG